MAQLLAPLLTRPPLRVAPAVEASLCAGAATLSHASAQLISSTTIVVEVGADDLEALYGLAHEVAAAHHLEVSFRPHVGWCSVRFCRSA